MTRRYELTPEDQLRERLAELERQVRSLRNSSWVRIAEHHHTESQITPGVDGDDLAPEVDPETGEPLEGELTLTTGANENRVYIDAEWTPAARARHYEVFLGQQVVSLVGDDDESEGSSGTRLMGHQQTDSTTVRFEPVEPMTNYRVQVHAALSHLANPVPYLVGDIVSGRDETIPQDVTGLEVGAGFTSLTATWDDVPDIDVRDGNGQYLIQMATDEDFTTGVREQRVGGTIASFTDLEPEVQVWVRVKAIDSSGNMSANWSNVATDVPGAFFPDPTDGDPPASSPAANVSAGIGFLHVAWTRVENDDPVTYEIHVSTTDDFTPNPGTFHGTSTGTTYFIMSAAGGAALDPEEVYYVKIIATDADGAASPGAQGSGSPVVDPLFELGDESVLEQHLGDGAVIARTILEGAVVYGKLAADSVAIKNLIIGNFDNLIQDPGFRLELGIAHCTGHGHGGNWYTANHHGRGGTDNWSLHYDAVAGAQTAEAHVCLNGNSSEPENHAEISAGQQVYSEIWANATLGAREIWLQIRWFDQGGNLISTTTGPMLEVDDPQYVKLTVQGTAPVGTRFFVVSPVVAMNTGPCSIHFDDVYTRVVLDGKLIVDGTITADQLVANIISAGSGLIGDLAVGTAHIANLAVTQAKMAEASIGTAQIINLAVETAKINDLAVTTAKINNLAVTSAKIEDLAVVRAKIADLAVDSAKIANLAVTTLKVGLAQIVDAHIQTLAVNKLTTGTLEATGITLGVGGYLVAGDLTNGVFYTETGIVGFSGGAMTFNLPISGSPSFTGNITGSTVTGGIVRTAASGRRIEMSASTNVGAIRFFSGHGSETTPGRIETFVDSDFGNLEITGPVIGSARAPKIGMYKNAGFDGSVQIGPRVVLGDTDAASVIAYGGVRIGLGGTAAKVHDGIYYASDILAFAIDDTYAFGIRGPLATNPNRIQSPFIGSQTVTSVPSVHVTESGYLYRTTHSNSSTLYKDITGTLSLEDACKVLTLEPLEYTRTDITHGPNKPQIGFSAEEVAEVDERWMSYEVDDEGNETDRPDQVYYDRMVVAHNLIIKNLQDRIEQLEAA